MRRAIRTLSWAVAAAVLAIAVAAGVVFLRAQTTTTGSLSFQQPLHIPPLLDPRIDATGRKAFDLWLQRGTTELLPGRPTQTWGINGPHLGPTLRAARGDTVVVNVHNSLPETTTLHWHGMHLAARADGGPHQPIGPGASCRPSWTIDQPAATLWYHPHLAGSTEDHVYRGVAGMWIVDDPETAALALPRTYGVDDIPLILQDKRLDGDGRLEFSRHPISPAGRLGDRMLINGTYDPHLVVRDTLVRLRLLNASTARVYNVGFADDRRFKLIASDAGLLSRPAAMSRVQLSPGERAEIVARFRPGERIVLRSFAPNLGTDFFTERFAGGDDTLELVQVRAADRLRPARELPDRLSAPEPDVAAPASRIRRFELSGSRRINRRTMDMSRLDAVVNRRATEIWDVTNKGNTPHNFHVHGVSFRIVAHAGARPPAALAGPKDTVYVAPGRSLRLAVRFTGHADANAPYMFHCHFLQHEDRGMMGQFVVVPPGARAGPPPAHHTERSRP